MKNIFSEEKPTIAGEHWTGYAWDDDILWLKVSDSSVQSYLKCEMAGMFKMMFFRYRFMNLIFIYFSKRGEAVIGEAL